MGIRFEDIDFGGSGIWVRFWNDNSNKALAKAVTEGIDSWISRLT